MTTVTLIAEMLASLIVGGLCVLIYLDMPSRGSRAIVGDE
jgi:hypothetical protein